MTMDRMNIKCEQKRVLIAKYALHTTRMPYYVH